MHAQIIIYTLGAHLPPARLEQERELLDRGDCDGTGEALTLQQVSPGRRLCLACCCRLLEEADLEELWLQPAGTPV